MQMETVSFYIIEWDDYGTEVVGKLKPGLSGVWASFNTENETWLSIGYNALTPWDSAFSVSFRGTKSPL